MRKVCQPVVAYYGEVRIWLDSIFPQRETQEYVHIQSHMHGWRSLFLAEPKGRERCGQEQNLFCVFMQFRRKFVVLLMFRCFLVWTGVRNEYYLEGKKYYNICLFLKRGGSE